jgi:hypothetical protein
MKNNNLQANRKVRYTVIWPRTQKKGPCRGFLYNKVPLHDHNAEGKKILGDKTFLPLSEIFISRVKPFRP